MSPQERQVLMSAANPHISFGGDESGKSCDYYVVGKLAMAGRINVINGRIQVTPEAHQALVQTSFEGT